MKIVNSTPNDNSYKSRLFLKLSFLFLAAFLTMFIGAWVFDAFLGLAENQLTEAAIRGQSPDSAIDPKLESELAKVLSFDGGQVSADIRDPFIDHSGISQNGTANTLRTQNSSPTTSNQASQTPTKTVIAGTTPKNTITPTNIQTNGVDSNVVVKEDTLTRIMNRDERIRQGLTVEPESMVFAIEDLLPVGVVSGGNGQDEIMLYSQSADKTYYFPVGTRFFNGTLVGFREDGAIFSFDETKDNRLKSWVRSIKPRSTTNSAIDSPNQTTSVGGGIKQ